MPRKSNLQIAAMEALMGMSPAEMERTSNAHARSDMANAKEDEQELPSKMSAEDKKIFESWGVKFLGPKKDGDSLFQRVSFPKGWTITPTDHGMWYKIKDANGHVRASMFYKSAFYDRDANIHTERRLYATTAYGEEGTDQAGKLFGVIKDSNGNILWRGTLFGRGRPGSEQDPDGGESAAAEAHGVLAETYPDWKDVSKYWDLKKFKFPKSLSQTPKGEMYYMWIGLYRDRSLADSGMNSQLRCLSDKDAMEKFKEKARYYLDQMGYDVEYKVYHGEESERRQVGSGQFKKKVEQFDISDGRHRYGRRDGRDYFESWE